MAIRSFSDVLRAYEEGRTHVQRFYKGSNITTGDARWQDWSFAPGQPGYDARVGAPGQFNPFVAQRNDAVWFPGIAAGETRHLTGVTLRCLANGTGQTRVNATVYDLVGVYPLLDGDSTDVQTLTNDLPLPRYADGVGVFPVLVNHVAPAVAAAALEFTYLDHAGVEHASVGGSLLPPSAGFVTSAPASSAVAGASGALSLPLLAGSRGVRAMTSLRFVTPPGGLFALYMYKPLLHVTAQDNTGSQTETLATERQVLQTHGWHAPRVYDGAHLGMFLMTVGSGRPIISIFGNMEFVWG